MSFESFLRLIKELDPVRAGVVNAPLRTIDANVRYIWEVLQAAAIGSTVYAYRQTVESEAKVGMAVYLNSSTQKFERGLATAETDSTTGVVKTAASSQVWGIIAAKHNATLADILLFGMDDIDISEATVDTPEAGTYYLSGAAPGRLTIQKPPVSVAVLRRTTDGKIFVMPQFVDFLDRHTHYQFSLVCRPAAEHAPPVNGARHVLTDPDSSLPGWLPADNPIFEGKAPPGAVYGYNLSQHTALESLWPPIPTSNAVLEWNKGLSQDVGFTGVPLGTGGLAVIDANGIWWMSDCYGDVPWPSDYDSTSSTSYSDSVGSECPRNIAMELKLYFAKVNFATDASTVLSIRSADPRIRVLCFPDPTREASTGHILLDLDLNLTVADDADGSLALKEFDPETARFLRGPIVEGLYTTQSNVNLVGTKNKVREISGVERNVQQGLVNISVDPADTKELDIQLVRLDGAEEAYYDDPPLMYIEFAEGDERSYRGKIQIPDDLAIVDPELSLRFVVLGRAAGTLPQLTFTARRVPRPASGLATPLDLPDNTAEFSVTCDTEADITTNQYVEATSEPFTVVAGDTVYFTVTRDASDGYAGAVGVLRQVGIVSSGV